MRRPTHKVLLIAILILASFLRLWHLGNNPPSVNWDEASIGYNAYSIAKTGRDEFGNRFPVVFRSLNDYKPPLYIYTDSLLVKFFGLSPETVRLPAAAFGILSVLFTYLLIKKLTGDKVLALFSGFLMSVSPWHLSFSRSAVESGFALFFIIAGAYFFLLGLDKKNYLVLSAAFFGLSLYAYQSPRIFVPLLLIFLFFWKREYFLQKRKELFLFLLVFLLFFLPLMVYLSVPQNQSRFRGVSIFDNPDPFDQVANLPRRFLLKISDDHSSGVSKVLHNRRVAAFLVLARGYFAHFNLNYLFLPGGPATYATPEVGQMYLIELPFFLLGFYFLVRYKRPGYMLVLFWIFSAPVVAAATIQIPNSVRSENMLPMIEVVSAAGIIETIKRYGNKKMLVVFSIAFSGNVFFYLHQYHIHMPLENSKNWQYGWPELINFTESHKEYKKVIFFPEIQTILDKSHAFVLFYTKYDPDTYLKEGGSQLCDFGMPGVYSFGRYEFKTLGCMKNSDDHKLFVDIPSNSALVFPSPIVGEQGLSQLSIYRIYYLDGEKAMQVFNSDSIQSYLQSRLKN